MLRIFLLEARTGFEGVGYSVAVTLTALIPEKKWLTKPSGIDDIQLNECGNQWMECPAKGKTFS